MAVTLEQFRVYVGISTSDALYSQLQGVLNATTAWVSAQVGARGSSTVCSVRPQGSCLILPVAGVSSVSVVDPNGAAVTPYDTDLAAGVVWLSSVVSPGAYAVTVALASSALVDEATLIIGKHLWESRRGNQGAAVSAFAQDVVPVPTGFAIPRRAAELLAPLSVPGVA